MRSSSADMVDEAGTFGDDEERSGAQKRGVRAGAEGRNQDAKSVKRVQNEPEVDDRASKGLRRGSQIVE